MKQQISIQEVAEKAGVSPGTVSRVIHDKGYIKKETREKVIETITELNYIPNRAGRTLKTMRTGLLMLSIPDTANSIYVGMIEEAYETAQSNGQSLVLYYTKGTLAGELEAVRMLREHLVDGLFLVHFHYDNVLKDAIEGCNAPVVLCGMCNSLWKDTPRSFSVISIDVYKAIFNSTAEMIRKGHRRIGYLGGIKGLDVYSQRYNAYRDALWGGGIPCDDRYVFWRDYTKSHGYDAAKTMMRLADPPTAVIASNDLQAIGFWTACREMNLSIPEEIEIYGMDNLEEMQLLQLSSIKMREREVGRAGTEILIDSLLQHTTHSSYVSFTPELVNRSGKL